MSPSALAQYLEVRSREVQEILGHASILSTQLYTKLRQGPSRDRASLKMAKALPL